MFVPIGRSLPCLLERGLRPQFKQRNDQFKSENAMNLRLRLTVCAVALVASSIAYGQSPHYSELANLPFPGGYPATKFVQPLQDEWLFQRAVQVYLWTLPALSVFAMKEGSEQKFGAGYNVLPIFKHRLDAKTLIPRRIRM